MTAENAIAYPSLRAYLKAHIDESWIMHGGTFAGRVRSAKGLLNESQKVALMTKDGRSESQDTLDLPVIERDGTVYFPEGTWMLGYRMPFDMPIMTKEFTV